MRYVTLPALEAWEAAQIPGRYGKQYSPQGKVTVGADSVVDTSDTSLVPVRDSILAIHADSAAWAFVDVAEAAMIEHWRGGATAASPSTSGRGPAVDAHALAGQLFRRGLATIDGHRAVDATMFDDSPNYDEGHLVELLLTERCNLNCGYCLAGANPKMPTMTAEVAQRTIDLAFATPSPVLAFEFSGGEPFLRFDLMRDIVTYIRAHPAAGGRPVYLSVQSNGTLLNQERVDWLTENQVRIGISFDGYPSAQDRSRPMLNGGPSFERLLAGIDLLQRNQVPFGALVVLNRSNVDNVEDLVDFLLDNDILSFKLNPISYLGAARRSWDDLGVTSDEVLGYFRRFLDLVVRHRYPLVEANLNTMLQFLMSKRRTTRCLRGHCGAGDDFQAIAASGDIYPCGRATQSPGLRLGNVTDPSIVHLAAPARRNRHIADIRSRRPGALEGCAECHYRQLCQAGCSAQAYERYGTVRHRTPECSFFKQLYPDLMYELANNPAALEALVTAGYLAADARHVDDRFDLGSPPPAPAR